MTGLLRAALAVVFTMATFAAPAQQASWVQIEAQPSEGAAIERAATYARRIDDVSGFRLGSTRWHAIVLGPYSEAEAQETRNTLRAARLIPADAFISDGTAFRGRFWPRGAAAATPTALRDDALLDPAEAREASDESRAEALRSERSLTAPERRALQVALRGAGFYDAAIDGAFGAGTRTAMQAWQSARGYAATGVLTTAERAALIREYDEILDGLGMENVRDATAGIAVDMPAALVRFDRYDPPFAHYDPVDDTLHRVLLISQRGDRATLRGLYDVMQTLEIVPQEGPRAMRDAGFTLVGEDRDIVSETEVRLENGQIKGFTLIWPAGDEARRRRVVEEMSASFATDPATVMDQRAGTPSEDQSIDLLAGLQIRRPEIIRSGFYVTPRGDVVTTSDAVDGCGRITLDDDVEAQIVARDAAQGLALIEPARPLAPRAHAAFQGAVPRLSSQAILSGYSFDGALGAPTLSYGALEDLRGLDGEEEIWRFALSARPGDAGGPVVDRSGAVLGMLSAGPGGDRRSLPEDVAFAVDAEAVMAFLDANGIEAEVSENAAEPPRGTFEDRLRDMTVLVGCWK